MKLPTVERLAWAFTIVSILFPLLVVGILAARMKVQPPQTTKVASTRNVQLMREKMLLQARVNLCEIEKQSAHDSGSRICDEPEEKRVAAYKKKITDIDRILTTEQNEK